MSERDIDLLLDLEELVKAMPRVIQRLPNGAAAREQWLNEKIDEAAGWCGPAGEREEFLRARPWLKVVGHGAARGQEMSEPGESERAAAIRARCDHSAETYAAAVATNQYVEDIRWLLAELERRLDEIRQLKQEAGN